MTDSVTRIVAVRHGETAWNRETRIQGHTDIPLSEHGLWQAEQVGRALADEGLHAIYSSDLLRAADTAQAIGRHTRLAVQFDDTLRERHFGRFEGLTHDEIMAAHPEEGRRWRERDPAYGPVGGETLTAFYERVIAAGSRLALQHPGQTIALVAHGGVLDCFYRAATHVGLEAPRSWKITNASVNRLLFSEQGFSLVGWADTRHLDDVAPVLDEATDGALAPGMAQAFNPAR
jgi:2,3-bisphosphoglycerate-dependent phosphoglycerate mutase